jgi:hypothetical protein
VAKLCPAPFLSYYRDGLLEAYIGWRPETGGFGVKLVKGKPPIRKVSIASRARAVISQAAPIRPRDTGSSAWMALFIASMY